MVIVVARSLDMQIALHGAAERVEKVAIHLSGCVAHILAGEWHIPLEVDAASEVDQHHCATFVHR